jgi:hypothetical protein
MATYEPKADSTDTITMLGWSTADTCTQALKAGVKLAGGKVPSRSQVLKAMSTLKYTDSYVRGLDWSHGSHSGQNQAQIVHLDGGTYKATSGFQTLPSVTESS